MLSQHELNSNLSETNTSKIEIAKTVLITGANQGIGSSLFKHMYSKINFF